MNVHKVSAMIGERELSIEIGKLAKQAHGSAVVRYGDTVSWATLGSDWSDPVEFAGAGLAFVPGHDDRPGLLARTESGLSLVIRANNGQLVEDPIPGTLEGEAGRLAFDRLNRPNVVYGVYDAQADADRMMLTFREGDTWTAPEQLDVRGNDAIAVDDGGGLTGARKRHLPLDRFGVPVNGNVACARVPVAIGAAPAGPVVGE